MDLQPTKGPPGSKRTNFSTEPDSSKESVYEVSVDSNQIPSGSPLERKPLDGRDIALWAGPVPSLAKPAEKYIGVNARLQVLELLQQMVPDIDIGTIRRVTQARSDEMAERVNRIKKALGREDLPKTLQNSPLLIDLDSPEKPEITLQTAMALALQIELAQQKIRDGINADQRNVSAWVNGMLEYRELHKAWKELHSIVTDICSNEVTAYHPLPAQPAIEIDPEVPWQTPIPLADPGQAPGTLPLETESRIRELELKVDHLQSEQSLKQQLLAGQNRVAALVRESHLLAQKNAELQQEIASLRNSSDHQAARQELRQKVNQLEQQQAERDSELAANAEKLEQISAEKAELVTQLDKKTLEVESLAQKLNVEEQIRRTQENAVRETSAKVNELHDQIRALRKEKEAVRAELQTARLKLEEAQNQLTQIEEERDQLSLQLQKAQTSLVEKEQEYTQNSETEQVRASALERELDVRSEKLAETVAEKEAIQAELQNYRNRLVESEQTKESLQLQLAEKEQQVLSQKKELETTGNKLNSVSADLQAYKAGASEATRLQGELSEKLTASKQQNASLLSAMEQEQTEHHRELGDLRAELAQAQQQRQTEEEKVRSSNQVNEQLAAEIERLRNELSVQKEQAEKSASASRTETEKLESHISGLEKDLENQKKLTSSAEVKAANLQQNVSSLETELELKHVELTHQQSELEQTIAAKNSELQQQSAAMTAEQIKATQAAEEAAQAYERNIESVNKKHRQQLDERREVEEQLNTELQILKESYEKQAASLVSKHAVKTAVLKEEILRLETLLKKLQQLQADSEKAG